MKAEQKIVAVGAASGVVAMALGVWACAIVFVVARAVFWLGYRLNPLYRAPGMSATAYMNLGMILYLLFCIFAG